MARHAPSTSSTLAGAVVTLLSLLPSLTSAAGTTPTIVYPWNSGPSSANGNGQTRVTWGSNDCVNMTWTSVYPIQRIHLECNEGLTGTGPPWTRVWAFNSTATSGNSAALFCVASCNPAPPTSNTCRFVLDVLNEGAATTAATAYSPDVSLNVADNKVGGGTTYPLTSATSSTASTATSSVATTSGSSPSTSATKSAATTSAAPSGGLSTGAATGIGVGVGLGVLALAAVAGALIWRRRRARQNQGHTGAEYQAAPPYYDEARDAKVKQEAPASELPSPPATHELDSPPILAELDGSARR